MIHGSVFSPEQNIITLAVCLTGVMVIIVGLLLAWPPAPALANTWRDVNLALAAYPHLAGDVLQCELCHVTYGLGTLNPYGLAYQAHGRDSAALAALEGLDSDGDGILNIDEIEALTSPGDAGDYPLTDSEDMAWARQRYPAIVGTRLESCTLCHCSCGELLDYGRDYLAYGRSLAALAAIEGLDSDGDGYANLAEIEALTFPSNASDNPLNQHNHYLLLQQQYPQISGTRIDACNFCHASEFSRNPYGADYANNGYDFVAIENLDSDGDGFTNIDEINRLSLPGHAEDRPNDLILATTVYPQLRYTDLDTCDLCHAGEPTVDPLLNPYGQAYRDNGRNPPALTAIEPFDSDSDGHANRIELALKTFPGNAADFPDDMQLTLLKYPPLEGTELHTCHLCHTATWEMNPYGLDFLAHGRDWAAFDPIENLDSDGDGSSNIEEITGLTLPGDPTSNLMTVRLFLPVILK